MINRLILGTAQFGLKYGINNSNGKPSIDEVFSIMDLAARNDIKYLDTADAYGDAIEIIGGYHHNHKTFNILSKFKWSKEFNLVEKVTLSLEKLRIRSFSVYSFHTYNDYLSYPQLHDELKVLKQEDK